MPMGRVAEAISANNVTLKKYVKGRIAQQFFFDGITKTVRSQQWKNRSLDKQGNNLTLRPTNSRWFQLFRMKGAFLTVEKENKVADIQSGLDNENRNILMWNKHGKINQQWDIIYVDEWKPEPKKGELNDDFGMYVDRDFFIVSQMPDHRYLDLLGNRNMVIKTPNGRKTQTWYFDQKSLTIKSRQNNRSWDITSAGRTNNMQVWNTNSGWF